LSELVLGFELLKIVHVPNEYVDNFTGEGRLLVVFDYARENTTGKNRRACQTKTDTRTYCPSVTPKKCSQTKNEKATSLQGHCARPAQNLDYFSCFACAYGNTSVSGFDFQKPTVDFLLRYVHTHTHMVSAGSRTFGARGW